MSRSKWGKFLDDVSAAREKLKLDDNQECFYRGHSDESYILLPTLLRHCHGG